MYQFFFKRPALNLLLPYISGLIFGLYIEIPGKILLPFILSLILILFINWKLRFRPFLLYLSLLLLFLTGLLFMRVALHPNLPANHIRNLTDGEKLDIEGVLYRPPETLLDRRRIYLEVDEASRGKEVKKVTGRMVLTVGDRSGDFSYGDRISFRTKPTLPRNFGNPGGFDYERFLLSKGILVKGYVKGGRWVARVSPEGGNPFWRGLEVVRDRLRGFLNKWVRDPERGILGALLLGEKGEIPGEVREAFIRTGTVHILAISGLHIGIVAFVSFWIVFKALGLSERLLLTFNIKKLTAFFVIIPVVLYGLIGGFSIPTQRAVIMVLVFLFAILLDREKDLYNTLALAAMMILVIYPLSILDVSFQLSFVAVLSIVYMVPRLRVVREEDVERSLLPERRVTSWISTLFLISLSASLGTSPVTAFYFHRISLFGLLSNLFVVPFIGFVVVPLTLLSGLISLISFPLAVPFISISTLVLKVVLKGVEALSQVPYASMWVSTPTLLGISLYYIGIISLLEARRWKVARYGLVVVVCLFILYQGGNYLYERRNTNLRVTFISVGQGDSTLIEFPKGKKMLIDGGGTYSQDFDIGERVVAPFLWNKGIKRIDYLVLTHPQIDHMKGLLFVAENFVVKEFWWNGERGDSPEFKRLMDIINKREIKSVILNSGSEILDINWVDIEVLHPPLQHTTLDINDSSLVLKLRYRDISLLFPGDLERDGENVLIRSQRILHSAIVKAPHHGSTTSSTEGFINRVEPEIAVFSVGYDNPFGFPHREVVERYRKRGVKVLRTDESGAITIETDGRWLKIETYR